MKSEHAADAGLLMRVPAFQNISRKNAEAIALKARRRKLARGELLIRAGEKADTLYIVLRGRFTVTNQGNPIADIPAGEPVGELAFFAGGERTADVVAARSSEVLCVSRKAWRELSSSVPGLTESILAAVSGRLASATRNSGKLQPETGRIVALLPGGSAPLPDGTADRLHHALEKASPGVWRLITPNDLPEGVRSTERIEAWLDEQETGSAHGRNGKQGRILIACDDATRHASLAKAAAAHSDTILIGVSLEHEREDAGKITSLEKSIHDSTHPANIHLVCWRTSGASEIRGTAKLLEHRKAGLHHHLALDREDDFSRLARFIEGNAFGAVFCGGGAFGTAHLGAMKALREADLPVDIVGGTSVGAAMAGAIAMGLDPDLIMDLCDDIFVRSKAMGRLNLPIYSVIDHQRFDEQMRKHYGPWKVEDTPINYFAATTSLTYNKLKVIREGELWQAVRASSSIPAVFPPMISDEGEVMIDGALMDNVPIGVMRDLKPGPNLILNFSQRDPWYIHSPYEELPSRLGLIGHLMKRRGKRRRYPSIFSILSRTMVVNSRNLLREMDLGEDILLEMPAVKGMGFLEWRMGRKQYHAAYTAMMEALEASEDAGIDSVGKLRVASQVLSALAQQQHDKTSGRAQLPTGQNAGGTSR